MGERFTSCITETEAGIQIIIPDKELSLDDLRDKYAKSAHTIEGNPYDFSSLGEQLISKPEWDFPKEADVLSKASTCCVDEGLMHLNPSKKVVAISGAGTGEDLAILNVLIPKDSSIRPHERCGKATLVFSEFRQELGLPFPTTEEVDDFAQTEAKKLGLIIGRKVGSMQSYNSGKFSQMVRPKSFHPANGAVINFSDRLLHNLLTPDDLFKTPWKFKILGSYWHEIFQQDSELLNMINPDSISDARNRLLSFAVNEALLPVKIATSDHGVGPTDRPFTYTCLIDQSDPDYDSKLKVARILFNQINAHADNIRLSGQQLNRVSFEIISYDIQQDRNKVSFKIA